MCSIVVIYEEHYLNPTQRVGIHLVYIYILEKEAAPWAAFSSVSHTGQVSVVGTVTLIFIWSVCLVRSVGRFGWLVRWVSSRHLCV